MKIQDLLSPFYREWNVFLAWAVLFTVIMGGLLQFIPSSQKTTIYFSVKMMETPEDQPMNLDPVEGASKITEMMAGWAKNPAFRSDVLKEANVYVQKFKKKISARKQNRLNVFWTLKLGGDEAKHSEIISKSLITVLERQIEAFNANSTTPISITAPQISTEIQTIPNSWIILLALFLGIGLSVFRLYFLESFLGRVSFLAQVKNVFPDSPLLQVSENPGEHNTNILQQFILTFESPRLVGAFPAAEKLFALEAQDAIDDEVDTPILLVRLGETKVQELENLAAIFGEGVGIVVFKK